MIIYPPEISSADGENCVAAHFELQVAVAGLPDILWYRFPEQYGRFTSGRMDPFVASLLLLAMLNGEDMEVRGRLSPRLAYGLGEYQRIFHAWLPERFKLIQIHCEGYERSSCPASTGAVACAFSGGVDSFYTLWSHLATKEPRLGYQISHALFIHGYDIFLADTSTYRTASQSYAAKMHHLGIELVTARTNIYEIVTPTVSWEWAHGAALIGVALVLDRLFARFFVPASHTYNDTFPWGSDARIDHLLSTESLEVVHDGAGVTRTEKTAGIAHWPATFGCLRVCWEKPDGLKNCCRCSKCVRTMTTLELLGALPLHDTFPLPLTPKDIRGVRFLDENEQAFARQVIDYAVALGNQPMARALRYALLRSRIEPLTNQASAISAAALARVAAMGKRVQALRSSVAKA